ncbi:Enoyl-CoA hydratase AFT3-1 [Pseudocercospora fuligena]|uniref:Enoyl-CoA hydratase AFT3-1 n=1 Tax=Pseudocercospora fuligena TaxID=685502 RepID=A0A8H6RRS6_9PEZI|nr:Enoyl-CoA hydratase AFT3-1 [Pseudocercospora fuligena]
MAPADSVQVDIPELYTNLPVKDIKISHYPESSLTATPVIVVTLNRPKQRNAFTIQMMRDFEMCYPMFDLDERVKVVVLTGSGDFFCAGADLEIGFKGSGERERLLDHRDSGGRSNLAIFRCRKPTICALNGPAVGLGMTVPLAATIRIAHAASKYGFVFARRGITMESNSSYLLPRLIGYSNALYLTSTADVFRGDSKYFAQLFQEVVQQKEDVLPRALELATNLAENVSGLASFLNRELIWRNPGSIEETHLVDSAVLYHMFTHRDCVEGVQSFFEKRPPKFQATLEKDGPSVYPWYTEVDTGSRAKRSVSKL